MRTKQKNFNVTVIKGNDKLGDIEDMAPRQDYEDIVLLFDVTLKEDIKIGTRKHALTRHTEKELIYVIQKLILPNLGEIVETGIGRRKEIEKENIVLNIFSTAKAPYKP